MEAGPVAHPETPPRAPKARHADLLWFAALCLGLFCLYALSAPRTVALEDDGEFILAGYFLGVAHPPGYPIHTLLAWAFSHLPIGSVAYRVHLLSAVLASLAAGAAYLCARRLQVRPMHAAAAALCLGVSEVFWSQAIVAEVYSLHVALLATMWLLSLRLHQGDARPRTAVGLAAATGLALANHWPLTVLAGPALLPLVWTRRWDLLSGRVLMTGAACALAPYLWLVWRSHQDPLISFYGPLRSLQDAVFFVLRSGYAQVDHNPMASVGDRWQFLGFVAGEWTRQFTAVGAGLALAGLAWLWRRENRAACASLAWLVFAVSGLLVAQLGFEYFAQSRAAFRVYPQAAYFGTAVLLGCGLEAAAAAIARHSRVRIAGALIGGVLAAALTVTAAPANWRPDDDWARAYGLAVLQETPADAILVAESDWAVNTLGYLHFIEGHCPGCTLVHPQGLLYPSRTFEPLRTPAQQRTALHATRLAGTERPVAYVDGTPPGVPALDRWLVRVAGAAVGENVLQISPAAHAFFRHRVASDNSHDATVASVQQELRRRYVFLLGLGGRIAAERAEALCDEFYGCLGLVEGLLHQPERYDTALLLRLVERAARMQPPLAHRWDRARVLELQGLLLARAGRPQEAEARLRAAAALAPDAP